MDRTGRVFNQEDCVALLRIRAIEVDGTKNARDVGDDDSVLALIDDSMVRPKPGELVVDLFDYSKNLCTSGKYVVRSLDPDYREFGFVLNLL